MSRLEKIIRNNPPVRFISRETKKIFLPGFEGISLYDVLVFFNKQVQKVGLNDRARSIAFSFLMAIPAATIFICTLIPYLPVSKKLTRQLLMLTREITPNQNTYQLVSDFLNDFLNKPRGGLLSLGLVVALFYASNAMLGMMRSFNKSLTHHAKRSFLENRIIAIRLTLVMIMLLIGSVVILVTQDELLRLILRELKIRSHTMRGLFKTLRWVVIIPLFYFSIAFIYRHAPAVNEKWKLFSPGTILATGLMILVTFAFSFWVNKFGTYNKVYGSIGTIMILMIVIYINSMILLVGYELNVSIHSLKQKAFGRDARVQTPIP
ncbi:MAG: YihY/virulence factor BrkB family protein [Bacteroidota bacterium]|nr:YihY/virulence factor BrkB family protein [Bacteroidota bacterium]MDP4213313.1 YihY/virulence factor BrkB family protein [Bacteroidota bacterium]MDP4251788.1 YihY/virulence factor BrkB family protein [Bacteroidota bacterium]